jgi:hypothetical protein
MQRRVPRFRASCRFWLSFCSPWLSARSWPRAGNFARRGTSSGTGCGTGCITDSARRRTARGTIAGERRSQPEAGRDATTPPGCGATGASSVGCSTPSGGISTGVEDRSMDATRLLSWGRKRYESGSKYGLGRRFRLRFRRGNDGLGGRPADDAPPVFSRGIVASLCGTTPERGGAGSALTGTLRRAATMPPRARYAEEASCFGSPREQPTARS